MDSSARDDVMGVVNVLALNSGSSSLKFGLYDAVAALPKMLLGGMAESIGKESSTFHATDLAGHQIVAETYSMFDPQLAIERIARLIDTSGAAPPAAIGHRIVHGGPSLRQHCLIDDSVLQQLEAATAFAPLHTSQALKIIRCAQAQFPWIAQVACFDTSFHAGLPDVARVLPIASEWLAQGIQRYGFHGLSCESILAQLPGDLPDRVIIAHLGNGASITAVKGGKSIDTSMGLTPSGGVIMGTRSGDLDPGILIYLLRQKKFDATELEELVDHHSGLLGISGASADMRRLHDIASINHDAQLAIEMFCYSVRKQIAAMVAVLEGVDLIVFTGGIGENDALARAAVCAGLRWMGVSLNADRNVAAQNPLTEPKSSIAVHVLPSREDEQIARHTRRLMQ